MRLLVLLLTLFCIEGFSQQRARYMVFFTDKFDSEYSLENPSEFLSQKSLDRRERLNISLDEKDLPVNSTYISEIKNTGVPVFFQTRWFNGVLIEANSQELKLLETLSFIDNILYVAPEAPFSSRITGLTEKMDLEDEENKPQNDLIGSTQMNKNGFRGQGVTIALIDGGFLGVDEAEGFSHLFTEDRISNTFNFVGNHSEVYEYHNHGTKVLSTMAGHINGTYVGNAIDANYELYLSEDVASEYIIEEFNWIFAAEMADSSGVDIISSSLGYYDFDDPSMNYKKEDLTGTVSWITRAADYAASKGIATIFSSGNQANKTWGTITFPSDCFSCFSVGSVNSFGTVSSFSSGGPTVDGRIKPDVLAHGESAVVIDERNQLVTNSGTSLAAPQIAGLLAGLMNVFPDKSPFELLEIMKQTANNAQLPDNSRGWGIPNFRAIVNSVWDIDQKRDISIFPNPSTDYINFQVKNPDEVPAFEFEIIDMSGRLVHSGLINFDFYTQRRKLDVSFIPKGIYFLRGPTKKGIYIERLTIN